MNRGELPPALSPGDKIRIVSPAGPVDRKRLNDGVGLLEAWGYEVELSPHVFDNTGFLAGSDNDRLKDLSGALLDRKVSCVFCSRGGYGVLRLLDRLPYDEILRQPVKAFVGFSDVSAFQLVLRQRCGWVSFSGPQVAMALSGDVTDRTALHLRGMLDGSWRLLTWRDGDTPLLRPVRSGAATGVLLPCNLAMLVSLVGTEFMPDLSGAILCIEDIDEPPYRVDRMLWQLRESGVLSNIAALVIGVFMWNKKPISDEVSGSALDLFKHDGFPIWRDLPYGHIDDRLTLPVGSPAVVDDDGVLSLCKV